MDGKKSPTALLNRHLVLFQELISNFNLIQVKGTRKQKELILHSILPKFWVNIQWIKTIVLFNHTSLVGCRLVC